MITAHFTSSIYVLCTLLKFCLFVFGVSFFKNDKWSHNMITALSGYVFVGTIIVMNTSAYLVDFMMK